MGISKKGILGATVILCSLSQSAVASDWYLGVGGGNAAYDITPLLGLMKVEDTTAVDIFVGERTDNLSAEAAFFFSNHDWEGLGNLGSATHETFSFVVYGVAYLPLGENFELFGKVGVNFWSVDVEANIPVLNLSGEYVGENGIDIAYGGGASIGVFESFDIRLDYQVLPGMGDGLDEGDISKITASLIVPFD